MNHAQIFLSIRRLLWVQHTKLNKPSLHCYSRVYCCVSGMHRDRSKVVETRKNTERCCRILSLHTDCLQLTNMYSGISTNFKFLLAVKWCCTSSGAILEICSLNIFLRKNRTAVIDVKWNSFMLWKVAGVNFRRLSVNNSWNARNNFYFLSWAIIFRKQVFERKSRISICCNWFKLLWENHGSFLGWEHTKNIWRMRFTNLVDEFKNCPVFVYLNKVKSFQYEVIILIH